MMMTMMIVMMTIITMRMIVMIICRVIADRLREEEVDGEALLSLTQVLTNSKKVSLTQVLTNSKQLCTVSKF